jgi:ABC-type multidrug transport system fused ATPase/permease subunit
VLFSTTLRQNLDPFALATDAAVTRVIERVGLGKYALDMPIAEGGSNLSVGERQLVCLGRAMMRAPRVLILDEATASVDQGTDSLMQQAVREWFVGTTVLIIAHRLHTIADAHRVLVLVDGKVAEYEAPSALLRRPDSVFAGMVAALGEEGAASIRTLADQADAGRGVPTAAPADEPIVAVA